MICPKCKKEMIVVERNDVELDYCMECQGFWFDYGEWNILCKKLIAEDLFTGGYDIYKIPTAETKEKMKRCPVCGKNMQKFELFGVMLDRCTMKHGVWFDKNEFSACMNAMNAQSERNEQAAFLGEVFNV